MAVVGNQKKAVAGSVAALTGLRSPAKGHAHGLNVAVSTANWLDHDRRHRGAKRSIGSLEELRIGEWYAQQLREQAIVELVESKSLVF